MGNTYSTNDSLIDYLVSAGYITQRNVERAFRVVERQFFLPEENRKYSHLPEKVTSGPFAAGNLHVSAIDIYAQTVEYLRLQRGQTFLNVGTGSGFLSTVVGVCLGESGINHGIEIYENLIEFSDENIRKWAATSGASSVGFARPDIRRADIHDPNFTKNHENRYDRIYIGFIIRDVKVLYRIIRMLKIGGILVVPIVGHMARYTRLEENKSNVEILGDAMFLNGFVPAISERPAAPIFELIPPLTHSSRQEARRAYRQRAYPPHVLKEINKSMKIPVGGSTEAINKYVNVNDEARREREQRNGELRRRGRMISDDRHDDSDDDFQLRRLQPPTLREIMDEFINRDRQPERDPVRRAQRAARRQEVIQQQEAILREREHATRHMRNRRHRRTHDMLQDLDAGGERILLTRSNGQLYTPRNDVAHALMDQAYEQDGQVYGPRRRPGDEPGPSSRPGPSNPASSSRPPNSLYYSARNGFSPLRVPPHFDPIPVPSWLPESSDVSASSSRPGESRDASPSEQPGSSSSGPSDVPGPSSRPSTSSNRSISSEPSNSHRRSSPSETCPYHRPCFQTPSFNEAQVEEFFANLRSQPTSCARTTEISRLGIQPYVGSEESGSGLADSEGSSSSTSSTEPTTTAMTRRIAEFMENLGDDNPDEDDTFNAVGWTSRMAERMRRYQADDAEGSMFANMDDLLARPISPIGPIAREDEIHFLRVMDRDYEQTMELLEGNRLTRATGGGTGEYRSQAENRSETRAENRRMMEEQQRMHVDIENDPMPGVDQIEEETRQLRLNFANRRLLRNLRQARDEMNHDMLLEHLQRFERERAFMFGEGNPRIPRMWQETYGVRREENNQGMVARLMAAGITQDELAEMEEMLGAPLFPREAPAPAQAPGQARGPAAPVPIVDDPTPIHFVYNDTLLPPCVDGDLTEDEAEDYDPCAPSTSTPPAPVVPGVRVGEDSRLRSRGGYEVHMGPPLSLEEMEKRANTLKSGESMLEFMDDIAREFADNQDDDAEYKEAFQRARGVRDLEIRSANNHYHHLISSFPLPPILNIYLRVMDPEVRGLEEKPNFELPQ